MKIPYEVQIHTSDLHGAGTDAAVYITLLGTRATSPEVRLESLRRDFERDAVDVFRLYGLEDLGDIRSIRLRHDNGGASPGWHVDYALVRRIQDGEAFLASFDRWLAVGEGDEALEVTRPAARMDTGGDYLEHPVDVRHAFHFTNSFDLPFEFRGQDWGYCGGMGAALLRRFREGALPPPDAVPPKPGTELFEEIRVRQQLSLTGQPEVLAKTLAFLSAPDATGPLQVIPPIAERSRDEWRDALKPHLLAGPTLAVLVLPGKLDWPSRIHQVVVTGYRYFEETGDLLLSVLDPNRRPARSLLAFCLLRKDLHGRYLADGRPIRGFFWNEATEEAIRAVPIARTSLVGATGP
jgi:hypothetical protein